MKQADEARSKEEKDKTKEGLPKTILKNEVESEAEKIKPIMFVQETDTQKNEKSVDEGTGYQRTGSEADPC